MKSNKEIIDFVHTLPKDDSGRILLFPEELATALMWWIRQLPHPYTEASKEKEDKNNEGNPDTDHEARLRAADE